MTFALIAIRIRMFQSFVKYEGAENEIIYDKIRTGHTIKTAQMIEVMIFEESRIFVLQRGYGIHETFHP